MSTFDLFALLGMATCGVATVHAGLFVVALLRRVRWALFGPSRSRRASVRHLH